MSGKNPKAVIVFVETPDAQARIDAAFDLLLGPVLKQPKESRKEAAKFL